MKTKNYLSAFLGLLLLATSAVHATAADNVIVPKGTGQAYLKANSGDLFPLGVFYKTDGSGNVKTLAGQTLVADNLIAPSGSGKVYLKDSLSRLFPASILYQTDGNGNVSSFNLGITSLNSLTGATQTFATGTTGTDFGISSAGTTHTFNLPTASASNRGLLSSANWSTFNAKQAAIPTYQSMFWVDKAGTNSGSCGSLQSPCLTIQQALTNIGAATSAAEFKQPKIVIIGGGIYDEDLTIPNGRILTLLAQGTVILGNGLGTNWSSTNSRNVTVTFNTADVFGTDLKPALNVGVAMPSDPTSTFIAESGSFRISGNLVIAGDGVSNTVNLSGVEIDGQMNQTTSGLTNLQANKLLVKGTVGMGTSAVLERCYDCQFDSLATINAINMTFNSEFKAGITVSTVQQNLPPNGFFHTTITGAFTGPASSARFDAATDYFFRLSGATLAGSATKVLINDVAVQTSVLGSQPTCTVARRGLMWNIDSGAGVPDILQICQKDVTDSYVWVTK